MEGKTDPLGETSTVHGSDPMPVEALPHAIAGYRIQRIIGKGGMGVVYEAWEESMRRGVALKVLRSGITPSANEVSRFEREAWIEVRRNPDGEIAQLAMRAATLVDVQLPLFGVLAQKIDLHMATKTLLNPKQDFVYIANYECALDEGAFKPIGSVFRHVTEASVGGGDTDGVELRRFYSPGELTPTPHQLNCRAGLRFVKTSSIPNEALQEYQKRRSVFGPFGSAWPAVEKAVTLYSETRILKTASINLFKEERDFPRKVFPTAETGTPEKSLGLKSIRVIRLQVNQANTSRCIGFAWPATKDKEQYNLRGKSALIKDPVVGFQLFGLMRRASTLPITADATLLVDGNPKPLLTMPFVWTQNAADFSEQTIRISDDAPMEVVFGEARSFPDVEDGTHPGHLRLVPSRARALETNGLDHYLGSELFIPLQVEVASVHGDWLPANKCK